VLDRAAGEALLVKLDEFAAELALRIASAFAGSLEIRASYSRLVSPNRSTRSAGSPARAPITDSANNAQTAKTSVMIFALPWFHRISSPWSPPKLRKQPPWSVSRKRTAMRSPFSRL
jgi:hypothetical protein